jgi:hypothetical protein
MATNVPALECAVQHSVYNNGATAIPAGLALVPDNTADRAARLPTNAEAITMFCGVTIDKIDAKSVGSVAANNGDTVPMLASGAVTRGDTIRVNVTGVNVGKGTTYPGTGAALIVGEARTSAADGELFELWVMYRYTAT